MADLATLLAQLNQNAYIMEIIIKAIHVPANINQDGIAHCKEYLGRALDHMIRMWTPSAPSQSSTHRSSTPLTFATQAPNKTTSPRNLGSSPRLYGRRHWPCPNSPL
jgi:hypothetical protein